MRAWTPLHSGFAGAASQALPHGRCFGPGICGSKSGYRSLGILETTATRFAAAGTRGLTTTAPLGPELTSSRSRGGRALWRRGPGRDSFVGRVRTLVGLALPTREWPLYRIGLRRARGVQVGSRSGG